MTSSLLNMMILLDSDNLVVIRMDFCGRKDFPGLNNQRCFRLRLFLSHSMLLYSCHVCYQCTVLLIRRCFPSSQYVRDERHVLKNAPYVDNSCKWAGGGFLSNIGDLLKFGNAMLYSYQCENFPEADETEKIDEADKTDQKEILGNEKEKLKCREIVYNASPFSPVNRSGRNPKQTKRKVNGFLKKQTMDQIWSPVVRMGTESNLNDDYYAMGWMVKPEIHEFAFGRRQELAVYHTGGAVGGSSVLLICPKERKSSKGDQNEQGCPQGIVVTILCNLEGVSLTKLASQIAAEFQGLRTEAPHKVVKVYDC